MSRLVDFKTKNKVKIQLVGLNRLSLSSGLLLRIMTKTTGLAIVYLCIRRIYLITE